MGSAIKRLIVLAVLVCIALSFLLSVAFMLSRANHEHDHNGSGGECGTCTMIFVAQTLIKQLCIAICTASFVLIGFFVLFAAFINAHSYCIRTPVSLKNRMNN